jgi:pimeloyl-ACP methyl ester carboxylesterase
VICLHGLTRNARDFEDLAPRLARLGRRVLAVDMRGRGLSRPRSPAPELPPRNLCRRHPRPARRHGRSPSRRVRRHEHGRDGHDGPRPLIAPQAIAGGGAQRRRSRAVARRPETRIGGYVGAALGLSRLGGGHGRLRQARSMKQPSPDDDGRRLADAFARAAVRRGPRRTPRSPGLRSRHRRAVQGRRPGRPRRPIWYPLFRALAKDRPLLLVRGALSDLIDRPDRRRACVRPRRAWPMSEVPAGRSRADADRALGLVGLRGPGGQDPGLTDPLRLS